MNEGLTLDDLAVPLRALRLLAADFGHLAAPTVGVSTIWPDRLELSFHGDLADFEAWRDALGIAPDAVTHSAQSEGRTRVLLAFGQYTGAMVKLVAYADVPAPALVGAAA
ncbi:hypothetical protein GCM10010260_31830 [Streptomyces filipinensis]|uniref:Uncharacterized protein n=1 Tax=Streptomyces filipinensis TaxID=66887 RepID=A0A918IB96_9ACTN|nr:hypothetical protein [Streptomyces filipinensis]GGU94402.1 hypothetical protein GCM10010260_31830 [Streptomyces filipinensis]